MIARLFFASFGVLALVTVSAVDAEQITCHVTADNHYGLYVGGEGGEGLQFYGRNEYGWGGAPGEHNWNVAEVWDIQFVSGDFVYVVAWDDFGAAGVVGDFGFSSGDSAFTDETWVSALAPVTGLDSYSELPPVDSIGGFIAEIEAAGGWLPVVADAHNGEVWELIPNVSTSAKWIWLGEYDTFDDDGILFIFRSPLSGSPTATEHESWGAVKALFR